MRVPGMILARKPSPLVVSMMTLRSRSSPSSRKVPFARVPSHPKPAPTVSVKLLSSRRLAPASPNRMNGSGGSVASAMRRAMTSPLSAAPGAGGITVTAPLGSERDADVGREFERDLDFEARVGAEGDIDRPAGDAGS